MLLLSSSELKIHCTVQRFKINCFSSQGRDSPLLWHNKTDSFFLSFVKIKKGHSLIKNYSGAIHKKEIQSKLFVSAPGCDRDNEPQLGNYLLVFLLFLSSRKRPLDYSTRISKKYTLLEHIYRNMTFSNDIFKKKEGKTIVNYGKTDPKLTFQQIFSSEFYAMKWMQWSLHNVKAV